MFGERPFALAEVRYTFHAKNCRQASGRLPNIAS